MTLLKNISVKRLFSINSWLVSTITIVLACILLSMAIINPGSKIPFFGLFVFPSILILLKPELGIWIILIFVFYINYLASEIFLIPGTVTWMIEVSLVVMSIRILIQNSLEKRQFKRSPIDYLLLFFVIGGFISAFINHNSFISTFLGFRNMLKMVLLFYCIVHLHYEESFFKKVINFLFFSALVQGPVALIQHFIWTPELEQKLLQHGAFGGTNILDFASGTTGVSGITSIYVMDFMCILIAYMLMRKIHVPDIFKWILLLIPILVGSSRASFLYLPIIILFMLRAKLFTDVKKGILVVLVFLLLYFALIKSASFVGYDLEEWISSPRDQVVAQSHFSGTGQPVGRIANIMFANSLLKSTNNYIFGYGPNSMSISTFGSEFSGKMVNYLVSNDLVKSATSFVNSQIAFMMLEWGFLGLGLYMAIIVKIYLMNRKFYMAIDDPYWKTISFGFSGIVFLYGIGAFYKALWVFEQTSCLFWLMAGIIFSMGRKKGIF